MAVVYLKSSANETVSPCGKHTISDALDLWNWVWSRVTLKETEKKSTASHVHASHLQVADGKGPKAG